MLPTWEKISANGLTPQQCYNKAASLYSQEQAACKAAAKYINEKLPKQGQDVIRQADEYMQGMHILCGSNNKSCFVGDPPLWDANPFNHPEYTFMLNRMEHWPVLLHAYYLTGEKKYAEKVVQELDNWIDTCPSLELAFDYDVAKPRFSARTPWRSLELGIRANRSWNVTLALLVGNDIFTIDLYEKMMKSFYQQAQVLYKVCPVLWPKADHNHYLTECMGLLEISCMCDFMNEAPQWQTHAIKELSRCAINQITPNGGQIEAAPHYHNECLFQMSYSMRLAKRYNLFFSKQYSELISSMFSRSVYTARPDGIQVPWGDSDAVPLVFEAAFYHYEAFSDDRILLYTKQIFGVDGMQKAFEKHIWKLDNPQKTIDIINNAKHMTVPYDLFHHDKHLKQVAMRTSWEKNGSSVFFSVRSPIHNDHAHIDPCGFDYYVCGKAIMPDSGRFTYKEGGDRYYYKSTQAHNTLLVNGQDAFAYEGTWAYGTQQEGRVLAAKSQDDYSYIIASHDSYTPAIHTRVMIMTQGFLLVLDNVQGQSDTDFISVYYQCDTKDPVLNGNTLRFSHEGVNAAVSFVGCEYSTILHGRVSRATDVQQDTRRLCLSTQGKNACIGAVVSACKNKNVAVAQNFEIKKTKQGYSVSFELCGKQSFIIDLDKNEINTGETDEI